MINVELPFPPSINHLWRRFGNRTLLSKHGRTYRARVCALLQGIKPLAGNLSVMIDMYPPDRRRRDVDNIQKALLDALMHGGAYHDDSQISKLSIERREVFPGGKVCVQIVQYNPVD